MITDLCSSYCAKLLMHEKNWITGIINIMLGFNGFLKIYIILDEVAIEKCFNLISLKTVQLII